MATVSFPEPGNPLIHTRGAAFVVAMTASRSAADEAAKDLGFDTVANSYFTTAFRKANWQSTAEQGQVRAVPGTGTVGAVILDSHGFLAAGGSTGGPTGKHPGRIGDTAVLGAGLYADAQLSVLW